jgi:predicted  nucleic acid-binding Zn-ribbon protein
MSAGLLIEILLGLLAFGVSAAAFFSATRANRSQSDSARAAVDAGAYQRAKEIYEGAIETLRSQTAQLHGEVVSLQGEVTRLRLQGTELAGEVTRLRGVNDELRGQIASLRNGRG